jgi:hypothetical protein
MTVAAFQKDSQCLIAHPNTEVKTFGNLKLRFYSHKASGLKQVSVSDSSWKRLGQFTAKKVRLIQRSTGIAVLSTRRLLNLLPKRKAPATR